MNNLANNEELIEVLRNNAEQRLQNKSVLKFEMLTIDENRLWHELQVHQIELEMQHENLHHAQAQAEVARLQAEAALKQYTKLFDFAPVAYFILSQDGVILKNNFSAENLLAVEKCTLIGQYFNQYLLSEARPVFNEFLERVFFNGSLQTCELLLEVGEQQHFLRLQASADESQQSCLLSVSDFSERYRAELRLLESNTLNTCILNSLTNCIAVLDTNGIIVSVNNAWIAFGVANGIPESSLNCVGNNYLEACKNSNGDFFDTYSETAYYGIKAVLGGCKQTFSLEYPCNTNEGQLWYCMTLSPLQGLPYGVVVSHEDITQRKRAKLSALRLKSMLEISMDGFCVLDLTGYVLEMNAAFAAMCGYRVEEVQGWHITDLKGIAGADNLFELLPKIHEYGYEKYETYCRHKDGKTLELEISVAFLPEFQQYSLYCRNISERKAQEIAIKVSEEKFRSIINFTPAPMILYDEIGAITFVNPAFEALFGYRLDDITVLNDWWLQAFPDEGYRQAAIHSWRKSLEAAKLQNPELRPEEFLVRCKNHALKSVLVSNVKVQFSAFGQYLSILYDITERKQTEAKLNAIFDAAVEGIITYGLSREIVSINAAVEAIFGYTKEELIGSHIDKVLPYLPRFLDHCNFCFPGPDRALNHVMETEGLRKNGTLVPLDLTAASYSVDSECYVTTIVRDISLRKLQEQQDKEHLDELAHVTRLGLMGEMASGIAHEVNQPLSAIASYAQAALNLIGYENLDLASLTEILNKTQQQALRAGGIILRMREFIKNNTQHRSTVDINVLIREAITLCNDAIKQENIIVKVELGKILPMLFADHIQLEQVLINLIRNSIDALKQLPKDQLRQLGIDSHLSAENRILVRVKDNGPGMSVEQQSKILTPFYTTKTEGMGMGLSISRSLIEAHGGTLHFNSKIGKGSTFYFCLPTENGVKLV